MQEDQRNNFVIFFAFYIDFVYVFRVTYHLRKLLLCFHVFTVCFDGVRLVFLDYFVSHH